MQDEFKTTVISFDKNAGKEPTVEVESKTAQVNVNDPIEENSIKNVLFNVTTKVPHVTTSIQPVEVEIQEETKKPKAKSIEQINQNAKFIPKFYMKEYHRYSRILIMWIIIAIVATALSAWALTAIIQNQTISNWSALTLIPGITLSYAFLVVYANNYICYRNEARNVDFSKEKIVTNNVLKLYKRLKTGYININWFCALAYAVGLLGILIDFIIAWAVTGCKQFGNVSYEYQSTNLYLILLIAFIATIFVAFFSHIFLLVSNYNRAAKIDAFYSIQIVSDEELDALKKKKNRRNAIIFLVIVAIIVLIGILIYKLVKSRKTTNNVTINN